MLATTDSTNAHALRIDPATPTWIVAGEQTGGRGRRGRPWVSPRGNFYGTLTMRPRGPAATVALRSFLAALALHETCVVLTGLPDSFRLKWPNDVLLNGGKLAGILLESSGAGGGAGGVARLAIGIGVNLIAAPPPESVEPGAVPPVSLLSETGIRITPEAFLAHLAPAYARREAQFLAQGFAPARRDWLGLAARLGQPITARTGSHSRTGIFADMDGQGALILDTPTGREAIPAADIFF
ncbi:biotin--[acetyl-CoA-carboxylase] ligase [Tabrizicola sp. DMG-N-6]|uniref:biotin--[biotin carboxyl-carrier protein] ligase n=1 Tax=Szabonella alba TaxID=2804194 RepID=A0A8K0VAE0_9RHOB|nr:biotin--[acetyl-CoA-carboxylase] ligase [Szabonella alba]